MRSGEWRGHTIFLQRKIRTLQKPQRAQSENRPPFCGNIQMPAGRPMTLDPEHRELLIPFGASGYVLVYGVYDDTILVLSVRHQKEAGY